MYCNKCRKVTTYKQMINSRTGKVNLLCNICLKNPIGEMKIIIVDTLEEISFAELSMTQKIAIIIENEDCEIKELFEEMNYNILQSTGLYFRTTVFQKDHLYSKCRYGDKLQKRVVEERKRNNYGMQKFGCNGILNLHRNRGCITIFFNHEINHITYVEKAINQDIVFKIEEISSMNSPSSIYRHFKSTINAEDIVSGFNIPSEKI